MRRVALVILYVAVALLVTVPPIIAAILPALCLNPTGAPCRRVTISDWITGDLATIWMPPMALAFALIWVIVRLHRAGGARTPHPSDDQV